MVFHAYTPCLTIIQEDEESEEIKKMDYLTYLFYLSEKNKSREP